MDLWETALGFMDAQILLTAEEMGLFDRLEEEPRTAAELAPSLHLSHDMTERLLTALCALGVVRKRDGRFANGPEASEQLVRGKPGYIGGLFRHVREDLYPLWAHFRCALAEERDQWHRAFPEREHRSGSLYDDPGALRAFMDGMHGLAYAAGRELASREEIPGIGWLVDVGGASGAFAIAMAEAQPRLRATIADLPPVRDIAEEKIRHHGLEQRVEFTACDFWNDPLPEGADAYALGFILHDWDTDGGSRLLRRIAEAAPPGARLIVGEYLLDDERTGPLYVARQDLNMLVAARGRERSAREYIEWFDDAGFSYEQIQLTSRGKHFIFARRR